MTQIAVNAGSSASVTLAAGNQLLLTGAGTYRVGPRGASARPTVDELIDTAVTIGPFEASCTVTVFGSGAGATYEVVTPQDVLDRTGRPVSGDSLRALVSGTRNPPQRRVATKGFFGRLKTVVNGADHTTHVQFTLEAPCDMMRVGVLNGTGVDLTSVAVSIGWLNQSGSAGGATVNAGTGRNCTFGGASTGTILGTVGGIAGTNDNPTVTWTDWMSVQSIDRTDSTGSTLPIHNVRVQIPAANANRTCWYHTDTTGWNAENISTAPYRRIARIRQQAVLAASTTNQALFTSTTFAGDGVAFIVQYVPRFRLADTLLVLGNSIDEGAGATVAQFGWPHEVQAAMSSQGNPLEICQFAIGGGGMQAMADRAVRLIQDIMPTAVFAPCFNTNDTLVTNAQIQSSEIDFMRLQFARVQEVCARLGVNLITSTGIPSNAAVRAYGATDSLRRAHNDAIRAYFGSTGQPLLDFDTVIAGLTDGNGQVEMSAALQADGIHPNTAGYQAMRDAALPVLRAALVR